MWVDYINGSPLPASRSPLPALRFPLPAPRSIPNPQSSIEKSAIRNPQSPIDLDSPIRPSIHPLGFKITDFRDERTGISREAVDSIRPLVYISRAWTVLMQWRPGLHPAVTPRPTPQFMSGHFGAGCSVVI